MSRTGGVTTARLLRGAPRIADIGTVTRYAIIVAVEAVSNGEWGAGLKRYDAGKRPPTQSVLPHAAGRPGDIPYIGDSQPVCAVIIAWPTIEFQPALRHRYRRPVARLGLVVGGSDSLAGTVNVARPRVRGIGLEATSKAAVQRAIAWSGRRNFPRWCEFPALQNPDEDGRCLAAAG